MAYRHCVLGILFAAYVHCLFTRTLPAFLSAVSVPNCAKPCLHVSYEPLCGATGDDLSSNTIVKGDNAKEFLSCQQCRGNAGDFKDPNAHDGNWLNLRDGACVQNWQYGLLVGYAFAFFFAVSGLAAGPLVDTANRKVILTGALAVWSVATAAQGWCWSFTPLLVCRIALGLAQSFAMPMSFSLTMDFFDEDSQGFASAVLASGICVGAGSSSLSVLLATYVGWRQTAEIAGGVGALLVGLFVFVVKEPPRKQIAKKQTNVSLMQAIRMVDSITLPVLCIVTASLKLLIGYSTASFLPAYYSRAHLPGYSNAKYAFINAGVVAVCGLLSGLVSDAIAHRFFADSPQAPVVIAAVGTFLSIPCYVGVLFAPEFYQSMSCLGLALLVSENWFGTTLVLLHHSVPAAVRGRAVSVLMCCATLVANSGPMLLGLVDPGTMDIRWYLLIFGLIAGFTAGTVLFFAAHITGRVNSHLHAEAESKADIISTEDSPTASPVASAGLIRLKKTLTVADAMIKFRKSIHRQSHITLGGEVAMPDVVQATERGPDLWQTPWVTDPAESSKEPVEGYSARCQFSQQAAVEIENEPRSRVRFRPGEGSQ